MNSGIENIILFDGVCNFCNSTVKFILKRDTKFNFFFASLQSEKGKELLNFHQLSEVSFDTFVYIESGKVFVRSTAGLRVVRKLGKLWRLLYVFILIPRPLRDKIYNVIAKSRYTIFGKSESCMIPTAEYKSRFLV